MRKLYLLLVMALVSALVLLLASACGPTEAVQVLLRFVRLGGAAEAYRGYHPSRAHA